jgi:hypothetical protein
VSASDPARPDRAAGPAWPGARLIGLDADERRASQRMITGAAEQIHTALAAHVATTRPGTHEHPA